MQESANIARHLPLMAARQPAHAAVKVPRGRTADGGIDYLTLSFAELDAEVDAWVARLAPKGVRRGDRVLVMVRQGLPLIAAAFALFKLGAVPVIIDPGMGRKNFLACVARSKPRVLLGIPLAQFMSHVFRPAFESVEARIWVSGSPTAQLLPNPLLRGVARNAGVCCEVTASDLAAVLFTSGSTGAPKGVCYEHGMFEAQVRLVRDTYGIEPGEVDLPMLPIFALFNPALGMTTVVPELDPSRPATVDPEKIVRAIRQEQVTNTFGSPTLWRKISRHCLAHNLTLPSVKRVLMAGAPVPPSLFADLQKILPNGTAHSPYGATEALPIATISGPEVTGAGKFQVTSNKDQEPDPLDTSSLALGTSVATATGAGTCLGRPVKDVEIKIIAITDKPIAGLAEARALTPGEIGEIIVSGPVVTKAYDQLPGATAAAKIPDKATVWHRMGDVGYVDAAGRLWFCGRKAERVVTATGTMHTEPCEQVFRRHPGVERCALVGIGEPGNQQPALVVQTAKTSPVTDEPRLAEELRVLARRHPHTAAISRIFFHPSLPVDVRHNAKIHRLALARWAATARACPVG